MKSLFLAALFSILGVTAPSVFAMDRMDMSASKANPAKAITGKGVVVEKGSNSVTLKHEPIPAINWPAMTMGFKVKDKMLLDRVKQGDKVEFTMVQDGKDYVITKLK